MNLKSATFQSRSARPDDEPFLRELFVPLRRPEFAILALPEPQLQSLLDMQFRAQNASYHAHFPNAAHRILLRDNRPIGRIWTNFAPDEIHLVDLALLPAHQNLGIGTAVLRELITQATPARPLRLSVAITNRRAENLYRRLGFQVTASDDVYHQMQWLETMPVADD